MKRNTVQRQVILRAVQKLNTHPSVEEVYREVIKEHPTISKVTVYRNLRQLAGNFKIRQVILPGEQEIYDKRADQHYHFKCKNCGTLFDIDIAYRDDMDEAVKLKYGFRIDAHETLFAGICPECQNNHQDVR